MTGISHFNVQIHQPVEANWKIRDLTCSTKVIKDMNRLFTENEIQMAAKYIFECLP